MRRSHALTVTALIASLLLLLAAAPVLANDQSSSEHDRILAYWTPDRIAHATPRDFVRMPDGHFVPAKGKPGGGGGGSNVTGASWNGGGEILRKSGKVVFTMNSGDYICTGTVIDDTRANYSTVLSAGHCAFDAADGGFARNWMFIPEFDSAPTYSCVSSKWGCWTAGGLAVNSGFANAGGFNTQATTYDWSFASVSAGGKTVAQLDTTVGSFGYDFTTKTVGTQVFTFGYPAAGKYHGSDLVYCADQVFSDPNNANLTWGVDCDMTGGSSGGPWLISFSTSTGAGILNSVNSYGYSGVRKEFGPKFNTNTTATYSAAQSNPTLNVQTP